MGGCVKQGVKKNKNKKQKMFQHTHEIFAGLQP